MFDSIFDISAEVAAVAALSSYAAWVTLAHRVPMMAAASVSPTPEHNAEAVRMVTEKIEAMVEGSFAAGLATGTLLGRAAMGTLPASEVAHGLYGITRAAMAPGVRRVSANARRLSGSV